MAGRALRSYCLPDCQDFDEDEAVASVHSHKLCSGMAIMQPEPYECDGKGFCERVIVVIESDPIKALIDIIYLEAIVEREDKDLMANCYDSLVPPVDRRIENLI